MAYVHQVQYYECDRMGVTHHSNYVRFMEEARIDMLNRMGYGFDKLEAEGIVSPVVNLFCSYKKPTTFMDEIEIEVSITAVSVFKITLDYIMRVRGEEVFTGTSTHCFIKDGQAVKIEDRFPGLSPSTTK